MIQNILNAMLDKDNFTRWLGIVIDNYDDGYCKLHFIIRNEMLNGFGTVHGGILFSAADSAFAFACNSQGMLSVALDVSISFMKACKEGDLISVEARKIHSGNRTGFYDVAVTNEAGDPVAMFRGTSYITGKQILQ